MTWLALPLRALLIYVFLWLLLRLSGKRALNHSGALDIVLALVLSSVASAFVFGQIPAATTIAALGSLLALHLGVHALRGHAAGSGEPPQLRRDPDEEPAQKSAGDDR